MLPEQGTKEYEDMVDFMRADLESNMGYSKIEMLARNLLKKKGRDFDVEFKKSQDVKRRKHDKRKNSNEE